MKLSILPEQRIFSSAAAARDFLAPFRAAGKKLVTTNGCFDIIHSGHVRYLTEAAALGDLLAIGLNADATVQKLKGPGRPVTREQDRLLVIGALSMVDCAFIFPEDDPRAFLDVLKPAIHVKGGDYTKDIIEREVVEKHGGRVEIVTYVTGFSTTSVVSRIRAGGN